MQLSAKRYRNIVCDTEQKKQTGGLRKTCMQEGEKEYRMRVSISIFAKKSKILENSEQRKYFVNREDRGWKDRDWIDYARKGEETGPPFRKKCVYGTLSTC